MVKVLYALEREPTSWPFGIEDSLQLRLWSLFPTGMSSWWSSGARYNWHQKHLFADCPPGKSLACCRYPWMALCDGFVPRFMSFSTKPHLISPGKSGWEENW